MSKPLNDAVFESDDAEPWTHAEHAFAGWIPNVSGHLSFNLIDLRARQPTFNYQPNPSLPRTIAVHRTRILQNYPFWRGLIALVRPSAVQDLVLLAQTGPTKTPFIEDGTLRETSDGQGCLSGIVAAFPAEADRRSAKRRRKLLERLDRHLEVAIVACAEGRFEPTRHLAREMLGLIVKDRGGVCVLAARFRLYRTGEFRLWFDEGSFLGHAVGTPAVGDAEAVAIDGMPVQFYRFVKELLHTHYHHNRHAVAILPLVATPPVETGEEQVLAAEVRWRHATLRGLVRTITQLRQRRSLHGHKSALGIVAYARAFQHLLARTWRHDPAPDRRFAPMSEVIPYEFEYVTQSIEAADSSHETVHSSRLQFFAVEVGVVLSALALWAGAVQIQPSVCGEECPNIPPGLVADAVLGVVTNPLPFTGGLLVAGVLVFVTMFRGPIAEGIVRWLGGASDAIMTTVSRRTYGSDLLGLVLGALLLLATSLGLLWAAWSVAPTREINPKPREQAIEGPWADIRSYVDKAAATSGLLSASAAANSIRDRLGGDLSAFVETIGDAPLKSSGETFFALSGTRSGGSGALLVIEPRRQLVEAVVARGEDVRLHFGSSDRIPMPREARVFFGTAFASDAQPVAAVSKRCDLTQGGTGLRTFQLSGLMRTGDPCTFTIHMDAGQTLTFDRRTGKGLEIVAAVPPRSQALSPDFVARRSSDQAFTIAWTSPSAPRAGRSPFRQFYARLTLE